MDLKAIKAEIEALYEEKRDKHEYSGDYRGGWDDCVERVLGIFKAEFESIKIEPTWTCQPTSAGYWYVFRRRDKKDGIIKVKEKHGELAYDSWANDDLGNWRWYKIELPDIESEGCDGKTKSYNDN